MSNEFIVSLDIGTSKVRVIIGELNNGTIQIVGVGSADSSGIKKGSIVDIDQTVQSIRDAVDQAERMVGIDVDEVYIGVSGNHIELHPSHGVVAVSGEDREIRSEDVERVLQASRVIAIPPEREVIDVVAGQFLVDGLGDIHDPRGMIGVRLEVEATVITGSKTILHNLIRCVEKAELGISGVYLSSLACSEVALSKDEKQLGVVLADVGAGTTAIAVFEQGKLVGTRVLPIGGEYITNDLSIGFRTQLDVAERIKLKYGCALVEEAAPDITFNISRIGTDEKEEHNQTELAEIVEPRVEEIFQLIGQEVAKMGYTEVPAGGYVLTGGAMSLPGTLKMAREVLGTPVRVAEPDYVGVRDPAFTSGVGMIRFALNQQPAASRATSGGQATKAKRSQPNVPFFQRVKNWFSELI